MSTMWRGARDSNHTPRSPAGRRSKPCLAAKSLISYRGRTSCVEVVKSIHLVWGTARVSPVLFKGQWPRHASLYATAGPTAQVNSGPRTVFVPLRPWGPRLHGWHSLPRCPGTFLRAGCERGRARHHASPCVCSEACLGGTPPASDTWLQTRGFRQMLLLALQGWTRLDFVIDFVCS